jgi:protein tyrosine phosphatase (PTP) superfamily phosphohydrolase (DUF442 family)
MRSEIAHPCSRERQCFEYQQVERSLRQVDSRHFGLPLDFDSIRYHFISTDAPMFHLFKKPDSVEEYGLGMKPLIMISIVCTTGIICSAAQNDAGSIRNFLRVNSEFCTGGQPRIEELSKLKAEGVKAIINLRPPSEHAAAEEERAATQLGLRYFNIPVRFDDPKDEQATEFLKLTDDPQNRPAFIHCAAAVRVGAFWMIRRVLRDRWSLADAEKEAEKIGLHHSPHLNEFARRYIEAHKK